MLYLLSVLLSMIEHPQNLLYNYSWPQSHLGNLPWGSSNVKTYCIHARRLLEDDTGWPLVAVCLHHAPTVSYVGLVVWFHFWAPQTGASGLSNFTNFGSHHCRQSIGQRLAGEHHHSFRRSEDPGVPDRCWHRGAGGPAPCWRQTWDGWSTDFSETIPKIRLWLVVSNIFFPTIYGIILPID